MLDSFLQNSGNEAISSLKILKILQLVFLNINNISFKKYFGRAKLAAIGEILDVNGTFDVQFQLFNSLFISI